MSATATSTRVGRELGTICGMEHVTEAPSETIHGCAPSVVVHPGSAEEIAAILHFANENNLTVVPAGGLTQQQTGATPTQIDILLYTTRLTEVEHYDPADLTIGIGAGCTVAKLCEMIGTSGLLFAGDPPAWQSATVGGLLATGITGPRRHGYGGLRDYCIGIKFVTGDGRQGKGGGRVVKNVAGYDMMKLLIGSWGTLGIVTGASFKLFPWSPQKRTFAAGFGSAGEAIEFRNVVLRSPLSPMCLELVSPEAGRLLPAQAGSPGPEATRFWRAIAPNLARRLAAKLRAMTKRRSGARWRTCRMSFGCSVRNRCCSPILCRSEMCFPCSTTRPLSPIGAA
jgi:glycolate oxidase FAD binding subunit